MTRRTGCLIVNADDWGRCYETTERTLECWLDRTVSSVSAMVFMSDSERAADVALERGIDTGLHLNLTAPLSATATPARLREQQQRLAYYLGVNRSRRVWFQPGLQNSFHYVVSSQIDEYQRLYGTIPGRIDGHHHMHLCANVVFGGLLPAGTIVRRNFTFRRGEKSWWNRLYRRFQDKVLARQHPIVDYLYSLAPLNIPGRLEYIVALAKESVVELETHPVMVEEYQFLREGGMLQAAGDCPIAASFALKSYERR